VPETRSERYHDHDIAVRERRAQGPSATRATNEQGGDVDLLIDDEPIPYGKLPDGQYFLHENAYSWSDDLVDLARRLIDYRSRTDQIRRGRDARTGG
jgi:hypothetical protein